MGWHSVCVCVCVYARARVLKYLSTYESTCIVASPLGSEKKPLCRSMTIVVIFIIPVNCVYAINIRICHYVQVPKQAWICCLQRGAQTQAPRLTKAVKKPQTFGESGYVLLVRILPEDVDYWLYVCCDSCCLGI